MVLEVAILNVRPNQTTEFEAAFDTAQSIISSIPGYGRHELRRCVEVAGRYVLLVWWRDLESHTVGFRESPQYERWKELLHHFYDPFPEVEHYTPLFEGTVEGTVQGAVQGAVLGDEGLPVIRSLGPSDREEMVRMRQALWPDSTEAEVDGLLEGGPSAALVLVADRGGAGLCGFAELGTRRYAEGCLTSPVAYLEGIWVDSDSRRKGVALALVREAETWARSTGYTEFASDCGVANAASQALHAAAGFDEVERMVCFRRSLAEG